MKSSYLFILAFIFTVLTIFGLKLNAEEAAKRRDEILLLDQAGSSVTDEIAQLREFTLNHINADIEFELTGAYQRAVAEAEAAGEPTGELYAAAQAACDRQGVSSVAQAACVQEYLNANLNSNTQTPQAMPTKAEYFYSFVSPNWAADLAGFSILGAIITALIGITVYIRNLIPKKLDL